MSGSESLINVLLVSGGGFQGLALLKGLLQADNIRVVLADCYAENIGRYFAHRSYVVPPISDRNRFLEELFRICEAEPIHVIFPCTELELAVLAEHAEAFAARRVRLAVSSAGFLKRICDKKELYTFLKEEGLPAPDVIEVTDSGLTFPILGKPRNGWGSKGQIVLHSASQREQHPLTELRERYVWQPFYPDFVEYSADFAIDLAGSVSDVCIRERVRVSGGFAVISKSRDEEVTRGLAERFARVAVRHGGLGIFNLQLIAAGDRLFISDVNPRMGTSATFGYGVGINLPVFVCFSGTRKESGGLHAMHKSVTMVRYLEELFVRNESLDGIRGVVFDLDDTLMSQKRWILRKLRGLYLEFKRRLPDQKTFLFRAMTILEEGNRAKLIDVLCDDFALDADLGRELIGAYRAFCPAEGEVYPEVRPLLDEMKRRGYRLGILTNNPPASQRQKIQACRLQDCFDAIVYAVEINAEKPAKEGFQQVAGRLTAAPEELVMVGDNFCDDIDGALNAGYRHGFLVARSGGFFNFDLGLFEELSGPDRKFTVITCLRDILRHLKEVR
jgi:HAD superfamily hydrolase (TIGR01509 family)